MNERIKSRLLPTLLVIAAPFLLGSTALSQQTNSSGREVKLLFTALDKDEKQVNTLKFDDLRITEDGVRQTITRLDRVTDRNLSLAVLIDTSMSQEATLGGQQLAARLFVTSTVRSGRDQAAIGTFTNNLEIEQNLTDDLQLLRAAIDRAKIVIPPGYVRGGLVVGPPSIPPKGTPIPGATAIWDTILTTCGQVLSQSKRDARQAIVLLTDGEDTNSKAKMSQAIEAAVRGQVVIYAVGIGDAKTFGINKEALRKVSESTGGRAFFPKTVGELTPVFNEIRDTLRSQYVVSYQSMSTKSPRKLNLEVVNPALKDVRLFYQKIVTIQP